MIKEGYANRIMGKIEARVERVSDKMAKEFKGIQPFDTERVSPEQQLRDYEQLRPQDIVNMIRQYGPDAVDKFIYENEQLKQRRQRYA